MSKYSGSRVSTYSNAHMNPIMINYGSQFDGINWHHLNYPKFVNVLHYDINDVDEQHRTIIKISHASSIVAYAALAMNIISVVVLASFKFMPLNVVYSTLDAIILIPTILYVWIWDFYCLSVTFYMSYLALAAGIKYYKVLYLISQLLLCAGYMTLAIIDYGPCNGFMRVAKIASSTSTAVDGNIKIYWMATSCVESLLYITASILGGCAAGKVLTVKSPSLPQ